MVWRKQQSMISSRSYFAASIVGTKQNKLWATGGQTECVSSSNTIHEELLLSTELYHLDEDVWVEGPELDLTRGGHCMMRLSKGQTLFAGSFTDNDVLIKATKIFHWDPDSLQSIGTWTLNGTLREARKHHSCEKFMHNNGMEVVVAVGGLTVDVEELVLRSAEMFYIDVGEWTYIKFLPRTLAFSTIVTINNRLLLIGGTHNLHSQNDIWLYDQETGWHLSNLNLEEGRYGHINLLLDEKDLEIESLLFKFSNIFPVNLDRQSLFLAQPNILVACGITKEESITDFICISQDTSKGLSQYCEKAQYLDILEPYYGAVAMVQQRNNTQRQKIKICGGSLGKEDGSGVSHHCHELDTESTIWQKKVNHSMSYPRLYAATAQALNGDWWITGGFKEDITSKTVHVPLDSTEIVYGDWLKRPVEIYSLPINVSSHCMVHVEHDIFWLAGGMNALLNLTLPEAYYQNYLDGSYRALPYLTHPRANHVCFKRLSREGLVQIVVAGGRFWEKLRADDLDKEVYRRDIEIFYPHNNTWSKGPSIPFPLAFAVAVSTPRGAWILGGKTEPHKDEASSGIILEFRGSLDYLGQYTEAWEHLPYELMGHRHSFVAVSVNTPNFMAPRGSRIIDEDMFTHRDSPSPKEAEPHLLVIARTKVYDLKVTSDSLVISGLNYTDWPVDVDFAHGTIWNKHFLVMGGYFQKTVSARYVGFTNPGFNNYLMPEMEEAHTNGGGGQVGNMFWIVGGKDISGHPQTRTDLFIDGSWIEGPRLELSTANNDNKKPQFRMEKTCVSSIDDRTGFLAGGMKDDIIVDLTWQYNFNLENKLFQWTNWTKLASLQTARYSAACGKITINGQEYIMVIGGASNAGIKGEQILKSVEIYSINKKKWQFTKDTPVPIKGGRVAVIENKLFHFGGLTTGDNGKAYIYEFVPHPNDFEDNIIDDFEAKSNWLAHPHVKLENEDISPVLIPYYI